MLLLLLVHQQESPEPDTSIDEPFPPYAFFQDKVPASFKFDIPKDDEEVLMMFAQFVVSDRVH